MEFLHIENKETDEANNANEEDIADTTENTGMTQEYKPEPDSSETVLDFVKDVVCDNLTENDIKDYEEDLELLSLDVDNNTKLLEKGNHKSLIALIAYTYQNDLFFDKWFLDFFHRNSIYNQNQKENYIYMKNDLEKFLDKKGAVT